MKELRYCAALIAGGAAAVTFFAYQTQEVTLAAAQTEIDPLSRAAPDVVVPAATAIVATTPTMARVGISRDRRGRVIQDRAAVVIPVASEPGADGRRAEVRTARRLATLQ